MKNTKIWTITTVLAGLMLPFGSQADVITINSHTDGQSATLAENVPTTVVDSSNYVGIRRRNIAGSERNNVSVFQFDTGALTQTATDAMISLHLYSTAGNSGQILVYGVNDGASKGTVTEANWGFQTVTYNTMPGMNNSDGDCQTTDVNATDTTYLGIIDYVGGSAAGTEITFSSASLTSFINSDGNDAVTFLFVPRTTVSGRDEYVNIESSQRTTASYGYPTLEVTVPEPATLGLFGLSSALLFLLRRIR